MLTNSLFSARQFESEIACLNIAVTEQKSGSHADRVAIGLWRGTNLLLLRLPELATVAEDVLPTTLVPRSVLLTTLESVQYLFVSFGRVVILLLRRHRQKQLTNLTLGDGGMISYTVSNDTLQNRKYASVGTRVVTLHPIMQNGQKVVFAASDRPTIISSIRQNLLYSTVNLQVSPCWTVVSRRNLTFYYL